MSVALILALSVMVAGVDTQGESRLVPSAQDLARKVIEQRRRLESGHVLLSVRYGKFAPQQIYEDIDMTYSMYFSNDNIRSDVEWRHPKWTKVTKNVRRSDFYISDRPESEFVESGQIDAASRTNLPAYVSAEIRDAFDPRLLGLVPYELSVLREWRVEGAFWYVESGHTSVTRAARDGRDLWRVDCDPQPLQRIVAWFDPACDDALVQLDVEHVVGKTTIKNSIISNMKRYVGSGGSGFWFPDRVEFRELENGGSKIEQTIRVRMVDFKTPVDKKKFQFEGLGLNAGRRVLIRPENRAMMWDGVKLVPERAQRADAVQTSGNRSSTTSLRWFWWLNALICTLFMLFMLVRLMRPARKS